MLKVEIQRRRIYHYPQGLLYNQLAHTHKQKIAMETHANQDHLLSDTAANSVDMHTRKGPGEDFQPIGHTRKTRTSKVRSQCRMVTTLRVLCFSARFLETYWVFYFL